MRCLVLCIGISLLATGSSPLVQEQEIPEEEWTIVSRVAEPEEDPVRVTLQDLWARPGYYHQRLVLVQGTLQVSGPATDEMFELREGRVVVPLLVDAREAGSKGKTVLASFNAVAVEVLGRFINMAPAQDRVGMLTDIDSIYVDSLRRLPGTIQDEEAETAEEEQSSVSADESGKPPRVISSNPRPDERGVPLSTKIVLRFSEDMDESSFEGNILLRYADESESDGSFPNVQWSYHPATTTLVIDPGQKLERRSEVHLTLQKGILSKEGVPMLRNTPSSRRKAGIRSRRSAPAVTRGGEVVVVLIFYTL